MSERLYQEAIIHRAIEKLEGSERGRAVQKELYQFLEHFIGLDSDNKHAVLDLIGVACSGYYGTVREALREDQ